MKKSAITKKKNALDLVVNYDRGERSGTEDLRQPRISNQIKFVAHLITNSPHFTETLRMKARLLLIYSESQFMQDNQTLIEVFKLCAEFLETDWLTWFQKSPDPTDYEKAGHAMKLDAEIACLYRLLSQFIDTNFNQIFQGMSQPEAEDKLVSALDSQSR